MINPVEGEGDRLRCDVYGATKLLRTFDVTEVPLHDLVETVRKSMGGTAKVAFITQHPAGVLLGRSIAEVKPLAIVADAGRFNSRRAFTGATW